MSFRFPTLRVGQYTQTTETFELFDADAPTYEDRTIDLTGANGVTISLEHANYGWVPVDSGECTITDAEAGEVRYTFSALETVVTGRYHIQFEIDWGTETELAPPDGDEWTIDIGRRLPSSTRPLSVTALTATEATVDSLQADEATITSLTTHGGSAAFDSASIEDLSASTIRGTLTNGTAWSGIGGGLQFDANGNLFVSIEEYGTIEGLTLPMTQPLPLNNYPIEGPGNVGTPTAPVTESHVGTENVDTSNVGDANVDIHASQQRELKTQYPRHNQYTHRGAQLDSADDTARWTALQGTIALETADAWAGSECIRWTHPGGNDLELEYVFDGTVDFTKWCPDIAFRRIAPLETVLNIDLVGYDSQGRAVSGGRGIHGQSDVGNPDTTVDWRRIPGGFGNYLDAGADPTDIQRMTVRIRGNLDLWPVDMLIDDLRLVKRPDQGYICMIFDNGYASHFTEGFSYMNKYNMPGVLGVHTDRVNGAGYITEAQLETTKDHGWEVISHNPLEEHRSSQLTVDEWRAVQEQAKRWLLNRGYTQGSRHHIYPSWRVDDGILEATAEHHDTAYSKAIYGRPPAMPTAPTTLMDIPRVYDYNTTLADQMEFVDILANHGGVGVWAIHDIGNTNFTVADWQALIDHIASKGTDIEVITCSDILNMATRPETAPDPQTDDNGWVHDGTLNLVDTVSGAYAINKSADRYKLVIGGRAPTVRLASSPVHLRLNGKTDLRYDYLLRRDAGFTTAQDSIILAPNLTNNAGDALVGELTINTTDAQRAVITSQLGQAHVAGTPENLLEMGVHRDVIDLSSFEIFISGANAELREMTVEVYRQDRDEM